MKIITLFKGLMSANQLRELFRGRGIEFTPDDKPRRVTIQYCVSANWVLGMSDDGKK